MVGTCLIECGLQPLSVKIRRRLALFMSTYQEHANLRNYICLNLLQSPIYRLNKEFFMVDEVEGLVAPKRSDKFCYVESMEDLLTSPMEPLSSIYRSSVCLSSYAWFYAWFYLQTPKSRDSNGKEMVLPDPMRCPWFLQELQTKGGISYWNTYATITSFVASTKPIMHSVLSP